MCRLLQDNNNDCEYLAEDKRLISLVQALYHLQNTTPTFNGPQNNGQRM